MKLPSASGTGPEHLSEGKKKKGKKLAEMIFIGRKKKGKRGKGKRGSCSPRAGGFAGSCAANVVELGTGKRREGSDKELSLWFPRLEGGKKKGKSCRTFLFLPGDY